MSNQKFNVSDWIAEGINSLGAVLAALLFIIIGSIFFSHTLFNSVFPDSMSQWEKFAATWVMALGWEFTVLISTVNHKHIPTWIPKVLAGCSGIIVLFFIDAFNAPTTTQFVQRLFVGALVSCVNYLYVALFNAKWMERVAHKFLPARFEESERKLNEAERALNEAERSLAQTDRELNEYLARAEKAEAFKTKILGELTCQHCKTQFDSFSAVHTHKGHCDSNPNKRKKINGHAILA